MYLYKLNKLIFGEYIAFWKDVEKSFYQMFWTLLIIERYILSLFFINGKNEMIYFWKDSLKWPKMLLVRWNLNQ